MEKKNVEFSVEEIQALAQFIDVAVRARGVEVAPAAVALMNKLQQALKPPESGEE